MHHMHGFNKSHWRRGVGFVALMIAGIAAITWVVMQLWNSLLPDLFGWRSITFVQALGLLVLSKIFFGGWHRGGHRHGWPHHGHSGEHGAWKNLSDEEREKLRSRFRYRCCGVDDADPKPAADSTP